MKRERQSNIELLRIIAACGVVFLHYCGYAHGAYGGDHVEINSMNETVMHILIAIVIGASNLFVIISGYFMSQTNKRTVGRAITLIFQVQLYQVVQYLLLIVVERRQVSGGVICARLVPDNWFVILYITLYLISPLINTAFNSINKQSKIIAVALILFLFSFWPTVVDILREVSGRECFGLSTIAAGESNRGYEITQFCLCYILGMVTHDFDIKNIRIRKKEIGQRGLIAILIIEVAALSIWEFISTSTAREYFNPLVIGEAFTVFLIFLRMDMISSKKINQFAKAAFSIYLAHWWFLPYIGISRFVTQPTIVMIVHMILSTAGIAMACYLVDMIYRFIFGKFIRKLGAFGAYSLL